MTNPLARAALFVCALLGAMTAGAVLPAAVEGEPLPSLAPMLKRVTPAVVNIATRGSVSVRESPMLRDPFFRHYFGAPDRVRRKPTSSLGSGVIVDAARGLVLTNHHVIENADEIEVTLRDGRRLPAQLVGADPQTDVAVVRVRAERLLAVRVADSHALQVGDFVVAIGNPFGLGQTVTSGIVSALGRSGLGIEGYEDFIQTDASINVGNSGGALVNLRGELVGINTAILAPNGGNVGIGFAIPVNMAVAITEQLLAHGTVRRGSLGIEAEDLTPELAEAFGLMRPGGAVVVAVEGGSAAEAVGIQPGDVVRRVNGRTMNGASQVRNALGLLRVGTEVELELSRRDASVIVTVELRDPGERLLAGASLHPSLAGSAFGELTEDHPAFGQLQGVLVRAVDAGSPAELRGLRAGDVVLAANKVALRSLVDLDTAARSGRALVLNIQRGADRVMMLVR